MADKHLHIVSFDVPWPADYGGVIDVFYKVKSLYDRGVKVHLHCFAYGRAIAKELEAVCAEVHYYKRNMNKTLLTHPLPFIVVSRQHTGLFKRLQADDYPILFEGAHCAYYLDHPSLESRQRYVRCHNVESDYYAALAKRESNIFKRLYLQSESKKLKRFESNFDKATGLFCISSNDAHHFSQLNKSITHLPPFHSNDQPQFTESKESYALYHGNLSVGENEDAARYLITEVFAGLDIQFKVFGKGASASLKKLIAKQPTIELIEQGDLPALVTKAQVNIMTTSQATGIKLKLLFSLYIGGHTIVNDTMVEGTGLAQLCRLANTAGEFKEQLAICMKQDFTQEEFQMRKALLAELYDNQSAAKKLIDAIAF